MTLPDVAKHYLMLEEEESRRPSGFEKRIVIRIDATWKFYWDIGIILLFIYTSFQVPYALAFDNGTVLSFETFWDIWNLVMDCLYMIDIYFAFITERYHHGLLVSRLPQIMKIYLQEDFALDFAGSFPFDKVVSAIAETTGGNHVNLTMMRAFKLVRLLRLLRGAKIVKFIQALEEKTRGKLSRVVHLLQSAGVLIFTAHTLGCFFVLLAASEENRNFETNWLKAYAPEFDTSVPDKDFQRYVTCLYWALITISTMGYGDVLPKTTPERCYVIFCALVGSVVFAYCMNNIGQMLTASSGIEDALKSNQRRVREYMEFRGISIPLQQRVFYHYRDIWSRSGDPYAELETIQSLPCDLRKEVLAEVGRAVRGQFMSIKSYEVDCIGAVFVHMVPMVFVEGSVIYARGQAADGLYIVQEGEVTADPS
jgi:hyperpolarization activated cyclic nucleotide-gated potassium channel 2